MRKFALSILLPIALFVLLYFLLSGYSIEGNVRKAILANLDPDVVASDPDLKNALNTLIEDSLKTNPQYFLPQGNDSDTELNGVPGKDGEQGATGQNGSQGIQGPIGPSGEPGAQGLQGPIGPSGAPGSQGIQGLQGPIGPSGVPGSQGIQGLQGSIGPSGVPGSQGLQGLQGPIGPSGAPGAQGSIGPSGVPGSQGLQGLQGPIGPSGAPGAQGPIGPSGVPGAVSSAGNGLSLLGGGVSLGGTLTDNTTIVLGNYDMTFDINGTGVFNIKKNSSSIFYINNAGNIGIGTSIPSGTLHIVGTSNQQQLIVQANSTQSANLFEMKDSAGNLLAYFTSTGNLRFGSGGIVYDDVLVPGFSVKGGAASPDVITFGGTAGNSTISSLGFDGTNTKEDVFFSVQLPHGYMEGGNIMPHIHWSPTNGNAGNVKWFINCMWQNPTGTFSTLYQSSVITAADGAWKHKISGFDNMVGTGKKISSIINCSLYRDPNDLDDTYGSDVALLGIDFHVPIDGLGSAQEYIK